MRTVLTNTMTVKPQAPRRRVPRPSAKAVIAPLAVVAVVWAALSIQAAILGQRQDDSTARLDAQIHELRSQLAQPVAQAPAPPAAPANAAAQPVPANAPSTQPVAQAMVAPAAAAAPVANAAAPGPPAGNTFAEQASDNKFSQPQLVATAGQQVTISMTNAGTAVHNLHIVGLPGANGKDVTTAILTKGQSGSVTFTPQQPGTYKFQCDVHLNEMTGTLTVQ